MWLENSMVWKDVLRFATVGKKQEGRNVKPLPPGRRKWSHNWLQSIHRITSTDLCPSGLNAASALQTTRSHQRAPMIWSWFTIIPDEQLKRQHRARVKCRQKPDSWLVSASHSARRTAASWLAPAKPHQGTCAFPMVANNTKPRRLLLPKSKWPLF